MNRHRCTVLWWKDSVGYGFASCEELPDVFVHHSELPEGRKSLSPGQAISFEVVHGPKGVQAKNVEVHDDE